VSYDRFVVGGFESSGDPKVIRVLAVYDALQRRDWGALQGQVAPVAVLRFEGRSRYAGVYQGLGQIIALTAQFEDRIVPFQSTIDALEAVGDEVSATVTVSFRGATSGVHRARLVERFLFGDDGRVAELVVGGEDQAGLDGFLG
jgi:hypothetical protein